MTNDNKEKEATLMFVTYQIDKGFKPAFMVTYHYRHPSVFHDNLVEGSRRSG